MVSGQQQPSSSYRVEVSGWDSLENFFVEKTTLEWSEETDKIVYLRHTLRGGSVVFIRLIDSAINTPSFPIAYQAEAVRPAELKGMYQVSLVQLRPNSPALRADRTDRTTAK